MLLGTICPPEHWSRTGHIQSIHVASYTLLLPTTYLPNLARFRTKHGAFFNRYGAHWLALTHAHNLTDGCTVLYCRSVCFPPSHWGLHHCSRGAMLLVGPHCPWQSKVYARPCVLVPCLALYWLLPLAYRQSLTEAGTLAQV